MGTVRWLARGPRLVGGSSSGRGVNAQQNQSRKEKKSDGERREAAVGGEECVPKATRPWVHILGYTDKLGNQVGCSPTVVQAQGCGGSHEPWSARDGGLPKVSNAKARRDAEPKGMSCFPTHLDK